MSENKKSARKFWWIIMLLPIGLAVGSVTSLVNHLGKNQEAESQERFKVASELNVRDIKHAMRKVLLFGERDLDSETGLTNVQSVRRFIEGDVSPGGTGQQWYKKKVQAIQNRMLSLSFTDIEGSDKKEVVAVVVELVGERSKGDTAKIGMIASLVSSLIDHQPLHTLRFVLTPMKGSAEQHASAVEGLTLKKNQTLKHVIVLQEQDVVSLNDPDDWKEVQSNQSAKEVLEGGKQAVEVTHPVLRKAPVKVITKQHGEATLRAALQLKNLLIEVAN